MQYKFRGLLFTDRAYAPSDGGLYLALRKQSGLGLIWLIPEYVGQGGDRLARVTRTDHQGLQRAARYGASVVLYSPTISSERVRRDYETLFRREIKPRANEELIPSSEACADAAQRLGMDALAGEYRLKAIAEALTTPPPGFGGLSELTNALATPPPPRSNGFGSLPQYRNPFLPQKLPGGPPPLNAFNALHSSFGKLPLK